MKEIIQLIIFFLAIGSGFGQEFTVYWDETSEPEYPEYLQDIISLPDGELAAVGYTNVGKRKKAIFFKIDKKGNRSLNSYREFSPTGEDVLNSITVTDYGRLIMVGSGVMGNRDGEEGLIIKMNADGSDASVKLFQQDIPDQRVGADRFEKIVWTSEGHGYVAGRSELKKGWIWFGKIDNDAKFIEMNSPGLGMVENIVDFDCYDGENSWLCANTSNSNRSEKGDVLVLKINKKGEQVFDKTLFGKNSTETAISAFASPTGDLLLGGEIWEKNSSNSDGFLATFSETGQNVYSEVFGAGLNDKIPLVFRELDGTQWFFQKSKRGKTLFQKLEKGKEEFRNAFDDPKKFNKKENKAFEPKALFKKYDGTYILAGNQYRGDEPTAIRVICFGENQKPLTAKVAPRLESQKIWLDDLNKDEHLSPLEDGAIKIKVKNVGDKDIIGGSLTISNQEEISGIEFPFPKVYIDYIGKGKERTISIAVKGTAELNTGTVPVKLKIAAEQYELDLDYEIQTIEVEKAATGSPITMFWKDPDITQTRSRELEVYDRNKKVRVTILSNRSVESSEPVMTNNGIPLVDDKSIDKRHLTPPVTKSGGFQYTFTYNLEDLKEGRNVLRIQLDEFTSDSIVLNYNKKRLPTLHVLAIGPKYADLNYPAKDAKNFVEKVSENIDTRFFDDIKVTTLVDSASTTKTEIEGIFEEFYNKFRRDEIESHDYFMVFYSGHGLRRDGKFFMVPSNYNSDKERSTTIDYKEDILEEFLNKMLCKKILFLDACLSGNAKRASDSDIGDALFKANQIAEETIIFTSCSKDELSYEHEDWGNGAYTEALLDAISGQAVLSNGEVLKVDAGYRKRTPEGEFLMDESGNIALEDAENDIVTVRELSNFLEIRVKDLVSNKKEGTTQTPTIHLNGMSESLLIFTLNKDKRP